jgi:NAD+--asparagine ADP-ribosyltransferase
LVTDVNSSVAHSHGHGHGHSHKSSERIKQIKLEKLKKKEFLNKFSLKVKKAIKDGVQKDDDCTHHTHHHDSSDDHHGDHTHHHHDYQE